MPTLATLFAKGLISVFACRDCTPATSLGTSESERRHEGVGWRIGVRTAVNLRNRADRDLEEIARAFNPVLQGWITYYGRFHLCAVSVQ